MNWISGGRLHAKSTPAACKISLTGMTARSAPPSATISVARAPRGAALTLLFFFNDAEARKKIGPKPDTAGASRDRNGFRPEQDLFDCLYGAHVGLWGPRPHGHPKGYSRKIHVCAGDNPVRGDQLPKAFPRENHDVCRDAAGELRGNRLRPGSLRRTRPGYNLNAACPLEFRQQLLVRATESAGYQNIHCAAPHSRKSGFPGANLHSPRREAWIYDPPSAFSARHWQPFGIKQSNLYKDAGLIPVNMLVGNLAVFEADNDGYGHLNWFSCWGDARQ